MAKPAGPDKAGLGSHVLTRWAWLTCHDHGGGLQGMPSGL